MKAGGLRAQTASTAALAVGRQAARSWRFRRIAVRCWLPLELGSGVFKKLVLNGSGVFM